MTEQRFQVGITSSLVDDDAVKLIRGVVQDVSNGTIPNSEIICVVSTREIGDDPKTDARLREIERLKIPLIQVSAKEAGRIKREPTIEEKDKYDLKVMNAVRERCGRLPSLVVMLGDMIVHGPIWCNEIPSLNLHPDLPLSLGGKEGMYWDVIGKWVMEKRTEAGGMMHLATPEPDAGTAVAFFRVPLQGIVNGVDLGKLWEELPGDPAALKALVAEQTLLKDRPTHPLFRALRQAEAQFETELIRQTLIALALGRIRIQEGKVLDLTHEVVGTNAIWPGKEGYLKRREAE